MAFDYVPDGRLKCRNVQISRQPHGERNVVHRGRGVELVEEPVTLLSQRQGRMFGAWSRREFGPSTGPDPGFQVGRQFGDGRALEQRPHRHHGVQDRTESRHHLGGDERIAAEAEEVVVQSHRLDTEHVGEHARNGFFDGVGRGSELTRLEHRLRQRGPVELSDRRQRYRLEYDDRCRNHVGRQRFSDERSQLVHVDHAAAHG
ncbi:unannotated protein [freshwater metagenome]|uniref:Unannotated protein n=1 Tax=freshwater metagenome TaxID=449393 RepID=A0A6J7HSA4_9ZZZZ